MDVEEVPAAEALGPTRRSSGLSNSQFIDALSERELEVLQLIAQGATNREIGEMLHISVKTVNVEAAAATLGAGPLRTFTTVTLPLQDVLHTFRQGHRLMIQVQSTWFPLIDLNPQTYVPNIYKADEGDFKSQMHTVFTESAIEFNVLNGSEF